MVCTARANLDVESMDPRNIITQDMSFELESMGDAMVTNYIPEQGNSVDGASIKDIQVIQTKLGTYIDVIYDTDDMDALMEKCIAYKIKNGDEELEFSGAGGSGLEFMEDGGIKERYIVNPASLGNELTFEAFDYSEGTSLGTVTATLK